MSTLEDLMRQVLKDKGLAPDLAAKVLDPEADLPDELTRAARAVLARMTEPLETGSQNTAGPKGAGGQN